MLGTFFFVLVDFKEVLYTVTLYCYWMLSAEDLVDCLVKVSVSLLVMAIDCSMLA